MELRDRLGSKATSHRRAGRLPRRRSACTIEARLGPHDRDPAANSNCCSRRDISHRSRYRDAIGSAGWSDRPHSSDTDRFPRPSGGTRSAIRRVDLYRLATLGSRTSSRVCGQIGCGTGRNPARHSGGVQFRDSLRGNRPPRPQARLGPQIAAVSAPANGWHPSPGVRGRQEHTRDQPLPAVWFRRTAAQFTDLSISMNPWATSSAVQRSEMSSPRGMNSPATPGRRSGRETSRWLP